VVAYVYEDRIASLATLHITHGHHHRHLIRRRKCPREDRRIRRRNAIVEVPMVGERVAVRIRRIRREGNAAASRDVRGGRREITVGA
jgi:hypothetical protein